MNHMKRLLDVTNRALFRIDSTLDYARTLDALELLANKVDEFEGDSESLWWMEGDYCDLSSLMIGVYWFCCDYHGGQWSPEYRLQCTIGQFFSPGMSSGPEPESSEIEAYNALERMHKAEFATQS